MLRSTFLEYKDYHYFKASGLLVCLAITAYFFDSHPAVGFGGTWLGYLLGILSTLIIISQVLYGMRRRIAPKVLRKTALPAAVGETHLHKADQWRHQGATLQGFLSAHVYLGIALIVLATLHTGFQFGWNLHTFAYVMVIAVILNGCYGIYAYLRFPRLMSDNMEEDNIETLLQKIADTDKQASAMSLQFSDNIYQIVQVARQETRIGGNFFQQMLGYQRNCPTTKAVRQLKKSGSNLKNDELKSFNALFSLMVHKEELVAQAWRDIMYRARLECWIYLHAPSAIASVTAVAAHIIAIFFYG